MSIINTNLLSLRAQTNIGRAQNQLSSAMERLSSGLRVNSSKDDAAGQAIGNRFLAQTTGLNQAARNANDGISLAQTAQGVLDSINNKLQRIRELTVQGLNGTLSLRDSDAIQAEINQNLQEIDRLVATSKYNGVPLLSGKAGSLELQVGANDGEALRIDLGSTGFSVSELGLEDLNIAGIDGEVSERNTLRGQAQDIPLYHPSTTLNFASGTSQPLYYTAGVGYYTSDGAGGFSRVSVSATHDTASDTSVVNISNPAAIYRSELQTQAVSAPSLNSNQRLLSVGGKTYLEERLGDNSLSYREVGFRLEYEEDWENHTYPGGGSYTVRVYPVSSSLVPAAAPEPGSYTAVDMSGSIEHLGINYALGDAENILFQRGNGTSMPHGVLVRNTDGELYIQSGSPGSERYYRLSQVNTHERLVVEASVLYTPDEADVFEEVTDNFSFSGLDYELADFHQLAIQPPGGTLVTNGIDLYVRTGSTALDYEYYEVSSITEEQDLTLRAHAQGFVGIDLQSQPALTNYQIPAQDFTSYDNVVFQGADFSGLSNLTLVQRTTSEGSWIIRGERADDGFAYFETNLTLDLDAEGSIAAVVATATQATPTILGVAAHERTKVSGYSEITIDPRNVTVEYTDASGQVFEDVLRQNEDGTYYFFVPGQSSEIGTYKTATLVDLEGTSEVVLRTVNGGSEVVIFHPSNVNRSTNISVVALTDGDGFDDSGVPHTRLQIRETGEAFRLRVPKNPLAALDRAIGMVDAKRSYLGAIENRLGDAIKANRITALNLSAARSRIMDAEYAVEAANLTRAQIFQQAASSVLAQANIAQETALALLQ